MKETWDVPFRYVFSGRLLDKTIGILQDLNDFEPIDMLTSRIEGGNVDRMIRHKKDGLCRWIFVDSGAFSVHTGRTNYNTEEYADYINSMIDDVDIFAQLDTIPGKFGVPKSKEDYEQSAKKSWDNFIYTRQHIKDKTKVMPIYHHGEDIQYLDRMLDYVDEDNDKLDYIGISPANDATVQERMQFLQNIYDHIAKSSNPNIKTHVYGFTSLNAMSKFPCYSADSITHRLLAGYNKIFTQNFGIISMSTKSRSSKAKASQNFVQLADDFNRNKLLKEFEDFGLTEELCRKHNLEGEDIFECISNDSNIRTAINVKVIQLLMKDKYQYKPKNLVRTKKLF